MNSHKLPVATHEPGRISHHLFKGDVLEVLNQVLEVGKVCQVNVLVARGARRCCIDHACAGSRDAHKLHPVIRNCSVLKQIDNGPAVGEVHVVKNVIVGWLDHLAL